MADLYTANPKTTSLIPDKNIITREKFGTQAKKILSFFRQNKPKIHKIQTVIVQIIKILKDFKRSLDIICIYEAMGLITRVTPSKYIYTGYRGVSTRLSDYENGKINTNYIPPYDEIVYEGKTVSIKSSLILGNFVALVFFEVMYFGRSTTKSRIEAVIEDFGARHKDISTKTLSQDIQNILVALNFVEKNETTQIILYIGPEFKIVDEKKRKDQKKIKELLKKEDVFFSGREQTDKEEEGEDSNSEKPVAKSLEYFHPLLYAVLKGKNWEFPMSSITTIIGRSGYNNNWEVDLDLPYRDVSRQHAAILFNFVQRRWEIRCLSRKNLIKVDGEKFAFRDQDIFLKDQSVIQVGPESFVFCLAEGKPEK